MKQNAESYTPGPAGVIHATTPAEVAAVVHLPLNVVTALIFQGVLDGIEIGRNIGPTTASEGRERKAPTTRDLERIARTRAEGVTRYLRTPAVPV